MQKQPSQPIEPLIADKAPWQRWRRDGRRLSMLLGFKPMGIAAIVLIVVFMWFDNATRAVANARHDHDETMTELSHMKALAGMRNRIEAGLKTAAPELEQARARGLAGGSLDEATAVWRGECQATIQAQNIMDVTVASAPASKRASTLPVAALDVEFTAVPQQLLSVGDAILHGAHYTRIATLDLVPDLTLSSPRLHVKMRLEAPYFPPKNAGQAGAGGRPGMTTH
ncbi:MAG: hypothetical protein JO218_08130 [Burkholderiales bacterium]|nr:hypothetical protein [Burkholderiales bacterium]